MSSPFSRRMFFAILLALGALLTANANAANWVKVVDSKTSKIYVDASSISQIGDIVSAWYRRDFNHPVYNEKHQKYRSSKVLNYYNCIDRQVAHAQWVTYENANATGRLLSEDKAPTLEYGDITADDAGEPVFNFVCGQAKKPRKK